MQQIVGGVVDEQIVLIGRHPLFLVVLIAGLLGNAMTGPGVELVVQGLED